MQEDETKEYVEEEALEDQVATDQEEEGGVTDETADRQIQSKEYNFKALEESKRRSDERAEQATEYAKRLERLLDKGDKQKKEVEAVEETFDFSDAVDGEYLQKIYNKFQSSEKQREKEREAHKAEIEDVRLLSREGNYIETINKYLPSVLDEDSDLSEIIQNAPRSKRMKLMLKFAKMNPDFQREEAEKTVKKESKIEKNLSRTQTLGAISSQSKTTLKENDVWGMDSAQFETYMAKIRQG